MLFSLGVASGKTFKETCLILTPIILFFLAKEITSELLRDFLFLVSKERSFLVTERLWLHLGKAEAVSINSLLTTAVSVSQLPCAA